jgi:hypothetical protein
MLIWLSCLCTSNAELCRLVSLQHIKTRWTSLASNPLVACLFVIRVASIKDTKIREHATSETQPFRNTDKRKFSGWAQQLLSKKYPFTLNILKHVITQNMSTEIM